MSSLRFVLPLFAAIGCVPTNTTITSGSFIAFLADRTSPSLTTGAVDTTDEGWDFAYNIDCREFDTAADRQNFQLPDRIPICNSAAWPPENEQWADRGAYQVVGGELDTYRGDALVNGEGDIQFAFHNRLPNGEDFRWVFAVDPDFQPTRCVGDGDGVIREPLDGDWIEEWSREIRRYNNLPTGFEYLEGLADTGRVYFINSQAYQIDPKFESTDSSVDDRWFLPNQWLSAAASGRFSEDLISVRSSRFGEPRMYEIYENADAAINVDSAIDYDDLWYCNADENEDDLQAGDDPTENPCMQELGARMEVVADETQAEIRRLSKPGQADPVFSLRPIVHLNDWRTPDGAPAGLDAWGEIEYSFVVFSDESKLEPGGTASGAFQIVFEGIGSTSRIMVKGTFETDRIRTDRWAAEDLFAQKAEENDVELCFEQ